MRKSWTKSCEYYLSSHGWTGSCSDNPSDRNANPPSVYGDKERIVYFDARTKIHLQNYIDSRMDDNPALFVTLRSPHERIKIGGIESRLREMGKQLDIPKSFCNCSIGIPLSIAIVASVLRNLCG